MSTILIVFLESQELVWGGTRFFFISLEKKLREYSTNYYSKKKK